MDGSFKATSNQSIADNSYSIDKILTQLSWNNTSDMISTGLCLARNVKCLKAFFQPTSSEYGKDVWENCAKVICEKSDDELEFYIEDMIKWLQDINWPGAPMIMNRLQSMESTSLLVCVIDTIVPALNYIGDIQWLENLYCLLDNQSVRQNLKSDTVAILVKYHNN